jgi:hypothetical protein
MKAYTCHCVAYPPYHNTDGRAIFAIAEVDTRDGVLPFTRFGDGKFLSVKASYV